MKNQILNVKEWLQYHSYSLHLKVFGTIIGSEILLDPNLSYFILYLKAKSTLDVIIIPSGVMSIQREAYQKYFEKSGWLYETNNLEKGIELAKEEYLPF